MLLLLHPSFSCWLNGRLGTISCLVAIYIHHWQFLEVVYPGEKTGCPWLDLIICFFSDEPTQLLLSRKGWRVCILPSMMYAFVPLRPNNCGSHMRYLRNNTLISFTTHLLYMSAYSNVFFLHYREISYNKRLVLQQTPYSLIKLPCWVYTCLMEVCKISTRSTCNYMAITCREVKKRVLGSRHGDLGRATSPFLPYRAISQICNVDVL